jgi:phage terminase small subunit
MRGRIPKPTALKELNGNPGHRRLPEGEPKPTGMAKRPRWLTVGARKVWNDLAPGTAALGMLTSQDGEMFGVLCELMAEFRADPVGTSANRISRMDALSQRFGMDPASRTRISVKPAEPVDDERRFFGVG